MNVEILNMSECPFLFMYSVIFLNQITSYNNKYIYNRENNCS